MKVIVVRRRDLWTGGVIFWIAVLHTLILSVLSSLIFVSPQLPPANEHVVYCVSMAAVIAFFLIPPLYVWYQRLTWYCMLLYGFFSVVAFNTWRSFDHLLFVEQEIKIPLLSQEGIQVHWYLDIITSSLLVFLSVCAGWRLGKMRKGRIIVQDGQMCPACGYNLHGNEDRICPECGRGYRPEELRQ